MQRLQSYYGTSLVHMAAHQSSCIVMMHISIYAAYKSYWCDLEQTPRELSVL